MRNNEYHGDEHLLDDDEYPPMQQWEIDEALADIIGDDRWLDMHVGHVSQSYLRGHRQQGTAYTRSAGAVNPSRQQTKEDEL